VVAILGDSRAQHAIAAVAVSPDGTQIAMAGGDVISIADAQTLQVVKTIPGAGIIEALAFTPDGKKLVGGHPLCMWNLSNGKKFWRKDVGKEEIHTVAFAPGGMLLTASYTAPACLRDPKSGDVVKTFDGTATGKLAFSLDGKTALGRGSEPKGAPKALMLDTDRPDARPRSTFDRFAWTTVTCSAFAPNGKLVAIGHTQGIVICSAENGDEVLRLLGSAPSMMVFLPDSKMLLSRNAAGVLIWNLETGDKEEICQTNSGDWVGLQNRGTIIVVADGTLLRRYDIASKKEMLPTAPQGGSVDALAFFPNGDGQYLLTSSHAHGMCCWDLATRKQTYRVGLARLGLTGPQWFSFAADGQQAAAANGKSFWTVNPNTGEKLCEWPISALPRFTRDGKWLVASQNDNLVTVWNPRDPGLSKGRFDRGKLGMDAWLFDVFAHREQAVSVTPPKSGAQQPDIAIWKIPGGESVATWPGDKNMRTLCLSPDERYLYSGVAGDLWIWDLNKDPPTPEKKETGHQGLIDGMAVSPDGTKLATTSGGELILWKLPSVGKVRVLQQLGINPGQQNIAFAPDSRHLAVARTDGRVLILRLQH
jgi:WD40 repeat protein